MGRRPLVAAAMSEHPLATHAVGESVGHLLEKGGPRPDLVVLAVTGPYLGALEDISAAVRQLLSPAVLIGAGAESVLGGGREVEGIGALTLFALWGAPEVPAPALVRPVRLADTTVPDLPAAIDVEALRGAEGTLVLLGEPFTVRPDHVVERLDEIAPDLVVVGGMASAARAPGGNRLLLDGAIHTDGLVGALIDPSVTVTTVVSQGCRPIGVPMTVTRAEGNIVRELAGRPALDRLMETVDTLSPEDRALAASGLHLGRVVDERRGEFGRGDFLIRNVLGADREIGSIAVGDIVEVGCTVQFHVRDATTADEDLRSLMADRGGAAGALVFTCNGRGRRLFGVADHDAGVVSESLDGAAVAGMFCAGEIGPIGDSTFVHGLTASVALFG